MIFSSSGADARKSCWTNHDALVVIACAMIVRAF